MTKNSLFVFYFVNIKHSLIQSIIYSFFFVFKYIMYIIYYLSVGNIYFSIVELKTIFFYIIDHIIIFWEYNITVFKIQYTHIYIYYI